MSLRIGIIGTGAIAGMHARAYKNIGYTVRVCTNVTEEKGRAFAAQHGAEFVERYEDVCRHPEVDFVDVCTFPSFRLDVVRACAENGKPVQVQKPIATTLDAAREMLEIARDAGIVLGVVSQHRFDRASLFLSSAIRAGRLGKLLQCDAYVKWWRSDEYYARPGERQLGDRGWRSADQSGDPPGRSAAVVCGTRSRAVRHVADSALPTRSSPRTSSMR